MRTAIPENNVSKDYNSLINTFISQICKSEKDNLVSIFLTGSFARGEAANGSDLDIWCIFNELHDETLQRVGLASRKLPISYDELEINAQCLTLNEFNSQYFSKFLAYPIIFAEGVLLYGKDMAARAVQKAEIEKTYKEFLTEILLSIRHYIAVNEPAEKLTFAKIKAWVLKPLMFALRLERYAATTHYPLTMAELIAAYPTPPVSIVYFTNGGKWNEDVQSRRDHVLRTLHNEVASLLTARV